MGGEVVTESWFSSLWKTSRKSVPEPDKAVVGILAFEVVSLMSKLVNIWNCFTDKEVAKLREEIVNSFGVKKLVSDDDDFLMDLVLHEIIENLKYVAKSVARLAKRCSDPVFRHFEHLFDDPIENAVEWFGWEYRWKKMERKVRKMERFIAATGQLHQEQEVLAELEQTLRRMQGSADMDQVKLLEFQRKVMWQRQEVRNLREMSPWIRTYDYTVRLLVRSLFTVLGRIKHVFEVNQKPSVKAKADSERMNADCLTHCRSVSALSQMSVHPSESNLYEFYSGPLPKPQLIDDKNRSKTKQQRGHHQPSSHRVENQHSRIKRLAHVGSFNGCMTGGSGSPVLQSCKPTLGGSMRSPGVHSKITDKIEDANNGYLSCRNGIYTKLSLFCFKGRLVNALPSTLGEAALALHYANVIILIEKLALSPHLIDFDARDDLYNMLPMMLRTALRRRLRLYAKTLASSVYDAALAAEWRFSVDRILEWLAPLAHNMIRWQSERNFEKQQMVSQTNVLLVQTLYFANQAKTEAAITELLMGLNYICRFATDFVGNKTYDDYMLQSNNVAHNL